MRERQRRIVFIALIALATAAGTLLADLTTKTPPDNASTAVAPLINGTTTGNAPLAPDGTSAASTLDKLAVKGRAPKTGYSRQQFGDGWETVGACNVRDHILARDMIDVKYRSDTDCDVMSGTLNDPYTGKTIMFTRGATSSSAVQIDHVVAISDAWQKGAQLLTPAVRAQLANDPLELLAVDGPANNDKSDADAATWLPPNKSYRCRYVARQIAVKYKYDLWVTAAEKDAMHQVLNGCPDQPLPLVSDVTNP